MELWACMLSGNIKLNRVYISILFIAEEMFRTVYSFPLAKLYPAEVKQQCEMQSAPADGAKHRRVHAIRTFKGLVADLRTIKLLQS
ncbi:hypothetical protein HMPREF0671_09330 [Prevotella sp. S7 MS 2]|nr:hypothetical protein HMPREF0671_09330 [Prevotella sp. S7 MS 2]